MQVLVFYQLLLKTLAFFQVLNKCKCWCFISYCFESCFGITTCWCESYKWRLVFGQIKREVKGEDLFAGVTVRLEFVPNSGAVRG